MFLSKVQRVEPGGLINVHRKERMRAGPADALDLTVICLEGGLSLEQAMLRVGKDLRGAHPDLAHEFYRVSHAMHRGIRPASNDRSATLPSP